MEADSPESASTRDVLKSNEQTIIHNFNLYIDNLKDERYFGSHAPLLAEGINTHFVDLVNTFPNANYRSMLEKASAVVAKTETPEIKSALEKFIARLESMKTPG